jgi:hypothetical protein
VTGPAGDHPDQADAPSPQPEPSSATGGGERRPGQRKRRRRKRKSSPRPTGSSGRLQGLTEDASRIVQQAASVLEEELAAGIVAARQVEDRFIDVQRIRATDPEQVLQRFRHDAHEVVDILVDLIDVTLASTGALTRRAVRIRPSDGAAAAPRGDSPAPRPAGFAMVQVPDVVAPGTTANLSMAVENNGELPTGPLELVSSDLVSGFGQRIPAPSLRFTPASLTLDPRSVQQVDLALHVPADSPPGSYSGLVQAGGLEQVKAVLVVEVG